jgi:NADH-quinone oxidoreductase subunit E
MAYIFNDTQMAEFKRLVARYPEGKQKSALLPVLHLAQDSFDGWLPTEALDYVASLLQIEPIEVYEVATFYSMYNLKPVGKYVFEVCQTGPCMISGSDSIIDYIKQVLSIQPGERWFVYFKISRVLGCLWLCTHDASGKNIQRTFDQRKSRCNYR